MRKAQAARAATSAGRPRAGGARRRLAPAERTEAILDEALKLFAERHYSNVTMRDLASACGVNPALIYHYFDSKEDLFRRALGHAIEQLYDGYARVRAHAATPRAEIMSWLDMHLSIAQTVTRMTQLMSDHSASHDDPTGAGALIAQFYAFEQGLLEDCIARGIAAGEFRDVEIGRTARTISLQLDGIFYASSSRGDDRIASDIADLRSLVATLLDP
ncbi:TetR/AcrR family transcriptional regulator [Chelatococcus sambhunathii]|uniref:TetR/AcrR family transcriptional regulator n=1 Tax=Chelatococcus sambhunathii TaxID=363953 RepID=A0ABU1DEN5_9HYPH|nr:helix-turn-helix domain-containing protein [Chelatococcus sambhunathii]MDR4306584.1 TetR/AcrR family transcriptional regulator [Chelatococcus sambhunathii]